MTCEEVAELLGAYALDALSEDEAHAVREHLDACPEQAAEARELRGTGSRLAAVPEAISPSSELRARVLSAVASTRQDASVSGRSADGGRVSDARERGDAGQVLRFPRRTPFVWGALAAAVVAAFVGLLAWNIVLQRGGGTNVQQLASRASSIAPLQAQGAQGSGVVIFYNDQKKALFVGDGLQVLDATKTYQLWAIGASGTPESIGLMRAGANGQAIAVVPFDPAGASTLAVTIEPAGGSEQPTSSPIYTASAAT